MAQMTLVPIPPGQADVTCAGCGAALVADQRYCLACGQPASPVRLAFLDVLQTERNGSGSHAVDPWAGAPTIEMGAAGYASLVQGQGLNAWLRRYSGLLGLFSVLALCLLVGLLVGRWVTQGKAPAKQVIEVKGLTAAPAAATATTPAGSTPASATSASGQASKSHANGEAEEAKAETRETAAEKAPPPAPVKVAPTKIKKLSTTTGKKHQEEINSLGAQPIETG
jgi:hypothetical protein